MNTPTNESTPSRARQVVLLFAITLAIITYVDRVCISQAAPKMQEELGLTKIQMGYAFTAFGLSYALFEIPGGWLGDRIGPRRVLTRVVLMWSIFTIATGWARSLWSLIVCRFLFGVGEAGCFPNITKAFTNWFPMAERVKAQGVLWLSARWGGAFTPLLVGWMLASGGAGKFGLGLHYKWVFLIFGLLGIVWAVVFFNWFRDQPKDHPAVNDAELAQIGEPPEGDHAMPWGKLLASRTVWMLWGQYFFMSYAWYFYITWFPTYLKEHFKDISEMQRALLACVPLFFGGIGSILAGMLSARLDEWLGSIARTRRWLGVLGMGSAGVMIIVSMQIEAPVASVLAIGVAALCSDLAMPGAWGACMDVGGRYTGALSGSMNMMAQFSGAMLAPMVVPLILKSTNDNWAINMALFAIAYFLGAICWGFVNSDDRLETSTEATAKI